MKNKFKDYIKNTFVKNMFWVTAIIIFCVLIALLLDFRINIVANNSNYNLNISKFIKEEYKFIEDKLYKLSNNTQVLKAFESKDITNLNKLLYPYSNRKTISYKFIVFDSKGSSLASNYKFEGQIVDEKSIYQDISYMRDIYEDGLYRGLNKVNFKLVKDYPLFFAKQIKINSSIVGYIVFISDFTKFQNELDFNKIDSLIIIDNFDNIIYSSKIGLANSIGKLSYSLNDGKVEINSIPYFATKRILDDESMILITLSHMTRFQSSLIIAMFSFLLSLIVVYIIIFSSSNKVAKKSESFINSLIGGIKEIKAGNLDYRINEKTFEEFQIAYDKFNTMAKQIKDLMKKNQEISEVKRIMELKQLESQFAPHFVYNIMEIIRYEIMFEPKVASDLIVKFSNLMKYNTNYGNVEVSLETDLDYIKDYLSLQKTRFKSRLDYSIEVDKSLLNVKIPKLIFQPIVENCIKHSIENTKHLEINIRAEKKQEDLEITILDNGEGIDENDLKEIRRSLSEENIEGMHIGLYNANRILKLKYGTNYGLSIYSEKKVGTKVIILMPLNG